jgi:hypothetical protein
VRVFRVGNASMSRCHLDVVDATNARVLVQQLFGHPSFVFVAFCHDVVPSGEVNMRQFLTLLPLSRVYSFSNIIKYQNNTFAASPGEYPLGNSNKLPTNLPSLHSMQLHGSVESNEVVSGETLSRDADIHRRREKCESLNCQGNFFPLDFDLFRSSGFGRRLRF